VTVGNTILVDNGLIKLLVLDKGNNRVRCKVLTRAILGSRPHINLPGVHVNLPSLTSKDHADVSLGVEMGAIFIGLSFRAREERTSNSCENFWRGKRVRRRSWQKSRSTRGAFNRPDD